MNSNELYMTKNEALSLINYYYNKNKYIKENRFPKNILKAQEFDFSYFINEIDINNSYDVIKTLEENQYDIVRNISKLNYDFYKDLDLQLM